MADFDFFPGIQSGMDDQTMMNDMDEHKKRWSLSEQSEFRFEIETTELVVIKLLSGTAEMCGSELPRGQEVVFEHGGAGCIYTWHGCDLEVSGKPSHAYVESDTTMKRVVQIHAVLEARRAKAKQQGTQGPRVLIVGPPDSGKSTVARLLLAYAARMFWKPTLVDMDLGAGFIGVPGAFGAAVVEAPLALRGAIGDEKALMYYYGSMQPEHNDKLRATLMAQLAAAINERMEANPDERASGCMMNTGAWHGAGDKAFVLEMIEMFAVDVVIVLNQRIFRDLEATLKSRAGTKVLMLQPSGGVLSRTEQERVEHLKTAVSSYFYGQQRDLSPTRMVLGYADVEIYQLGGGMAAGASMLPIGEESTVDLLELTPVAKSKDALLHVLCGVSLASGLDEVLASPVAGFVLISEVDPVQQTITILAPCMSELGSGLPSNILIIGAPGAQGRDLRFSEV